MMTTEIIEATIDGVDCLVEIDYTPGTDYFIHSASLEPNDEDEFEIVEVMDLDENPDPDLSARLTRQDEARIYKAYTEAKRNEIWEPDVE